MKENLSDDVLMKQFSNCSLEAFKTLYNRKKNVLYNHIIFSNRMKPEIAQDIVQNTLIKVYESKFIYNHRRKFNAWLFTIAKNLVINEVKRNIKSSERDNICINEQSKSYTIDSDNSDNSDDFKMKVEIIKTEILKLKDIYRQVIWLKYIENLSLKEISEVTNKKLNTVRSDLKRGLESLSENLRNINFENE